MAAAQQQQGAAAVFSLFRAILRLHRQRLPPPMRSMGDTYCKTEFRRHLRSQTSEEQWRTFAREWQHYAAMLGGQLDALQAAAPVAVQPPAGQGGAAGGEQQGLGSVAASIARGSGDATEQLLEHLSPDQRRQLIKLQQEALSLGARMLGKGGSAEGDGEAAGGAPREGGKQP